MADGMLRLDGISVNDNAINSVKNKYFANDEAFAETHYVTKNTPIFDNVVANIKDTGASERDLTSKDILAKYIGGISGFKQVAGSSFEQAFVKANKDDFAQAGSIKKKDGTEVPLFKFNKETSDGKVTMPSVEIDKSGQEYWVINNQKFRLNKDTDTIEEIK